MNDRNITLGTIRYDTGELYFEGAYDCSDWYRDEPWKPVTLVEGIHYYKNGNKYREGKFQRAGLLAGREYYESGALKFDGVFNNKHTDGDSGYPIEGVLYGADGTVQQEGTIWIDSGYYGPSYPVEGKFYSEDGTLLYEGKFQIAHQGSLGYPKVVIPEGFGSLR